MAAAPPPRPRAAVGAGPRAGRLARPPRGGTPAGVSRARRGRARGPPPAHAVPPHTELDPRNQFRELVRRDAGGREVFTVAGFGSLLSEVSARTTFPDLENYCVAEIRGYRRVFAHACPIFYEMGIAKRETREESSLSCEPTGDPESKIVVAVFDVPWSEAAVDAFVEREHEFRFRAVPYTPLKGAGTLMGTLFGVGGISATEPGTAVLCTKYTDEEYKSVRLNGDAAEWERRYGQYGVTTIWNDPDIKPCRTYLRHCVLASQKRGKAAQKSFLDDTFLADRETPLRVWLGKNPTILFENPPEELAERYGG